MIRLVERPPSGHMNMRVLYYRGSTMDVPGLGRGRVVCIVRRVMGRHAYLVDFRKDD